MDIRVLLAKYLTCIIATIVFAQANITIKENTTWPNDLTLSESVNILAGATLTINKGVNISIEFVSGLLVSGYIKKILLKDGKPILISLIDASVKLEKKYLFKPEWGNYDLSCGGNIISIAGGPADSDNY